MIRLIKLITWIAIISGGILFWNYLQYENTVIKHSDSTLRVEPGDTFRSLLIDKGASELFTKIYLSENTPDFGLQVGSYIVPESSTVPEFLEALKSPINETDISLTFLEGWNIFDIDESLASEGYLDANEFIDFAENHNLGDEYVFLEGISSLEGYLYPETYAFNPNNISPEIIARKMLDTFNTRIYQQFFSHADNETIFEKIILASIVEKEERNPDERPTVAGILSKRLDEGWQIGADITVCYPFRLTSEECKFSVTKYLYEQNDYNTRQKYGLPAGPIGNPSESSVSAVLFSEDTDYYYYLHDTLTGEIYYGRTNAEHERNKQLYLR